MYEKKKPVKTLTLGVSDILSWDFETNQSETYKSCTVTYRDPKIKSATSAGGFYLTDEEKEALKSENEKSEEMLKAMCDAIGKVSAVRFTTSLVKHPVCLSSEGELSVEMEKVLKKMPGADGMAPSANVVMEINLNHPIAEKLKSLYESDKSALEKYAKILYAEACLIGGVALDNPAELCELVSELMI